MMRWCGVIVPATRAADAVEFLAARGEVAHIIGEVRAGDRGVLIEE